MNTIGRKFRITVFGESHGKIIGVIIDGVPPGLDLTDKDIEIELNKRKPIDFDISTNRIEKDAVKIQSGVFNNKTTGAPILMTISNQNTDSQKYDMMKDIPRPGHADYTSFVKYKGLNDYRGGGMFSGRLTACLVMAGALAKKILKREGIKIAAHTTQIGKIQLEKGLSFDEIENNRWKNSVRCADIDLEKKMYDEIVNVKNNNDSIGGVIECHIINMKPGIGEPLFDTMEGEISKLIFSIPGVKGISFGSGFKCAEMFGSEHNDEFMIKDDKIVTKTNNSGGILGGITNGMPIVFKVALKPTASISKKQKSINLKTFKDEELIIQGRHDPCIVPRAVVVVEACAAISILDMIMR
jgi:chorismate synthase